MTQFWPDLSEQLASALLNSSKVSRYFKSEETLFLDVSSHVQVSCKL